jgi:fructokinase
LLQKARDQGAYLIYDPNFRKNHASGIKVYRPIIEENFGLAHLVRGSDEDFQTIYEDLSVKEVLDKVSSFGSDAMITANADGVFCLVSGEHFHVEAHNIEPVSTIGAGDNFNAGLAHGIAKENFPGVDVKKWEGIVKCAISFSSDVCMSLDNYISGDFADSL